MEEANTDFCRMISETISLELRRGRRTVSTAANGGTFMPGNLHYLDVVRGKFSFSHPEMQDMTLVPGQGILIAPGTRYSICVDGDPGEIRYVHIDFSVFGSVALGSVCRYSPLVSKELTGPIGDCIEKIYAITGSKGPRSLEEIVYPKQVKAALMHLLLRHFDDTESVMEVLCAYRVLAPVFEFIKVNLDRPIKRKDLAEIMKMSESRFSVVFSKIMNESPMTYVRNYKLREARVLMLANGLNVKEAAAAIGFCDEFHFSKMFKKHFGVSPTDC